MSSHILSYMHTAGILYLYTCALHFNWYLCSAYFSFFFLHFQLHFRYQLTKENSYNVLYTTRGIIFYAHTFTCAFVCALDIKKYVEGSEQFVKVSFIRAWKNAIPFYLMHTFFSLSLSLSLVSCSAFLTRHNVLVGSMDKRLSVGKLHTWKIQCVAQEICAQIRFSTSFEI